MAIINALDRTKHFSEFSDPLFSQEGVLSPSVRRARALSNLFGAGDLSDPGISGNATFQDDVTINGSLDVDTNLNVDGNVVVDGTLAPSVTGTAGTGVTALETGDVTSHRTVLTLADVELFATEPDMEDLAGGALIYTFPAGDILIYNAMMYVTVTKAGEATIADGEIGLGTVIGSTAVDTLGEVDAGAEDIIGPIVVSTGEFDGAQVYQGTNATSGYKVIATAGAHTVHFNVAATWPDVTASGTVTGDGYVVLEWAVVG